MRFSTPGSQTDPLMVNRKNELELLRRWGVRGGHPLLIVGHAGVGKSTLVSAYARISHNSYSKQYVLTPHAPEADLNKIGLELAETGTDSRPVLVAIDGLDEFYPGQQHKVVEQVLRLARAHQSVRWLLTARTTHLEGISPHVSPKELGFEVLSLSGLTQQEAMELLQRRLPEQAQELAWEFFQRVAHRLDGNPAILGLIADQMVVRSDLDTVLADLEARLADGLTNLLVVPTDAHMRIIPVAQMPVETISVEGIVIPTTPYVFIPRIGRYWSNALGQFESLLNDPATEEKHFQKFFETYPRFLAGIDYDQVVPQPVLERDDDDDLKPDFFLQPIDRGFADILDLKLPKERLVVGPKNRLHFGHKAAEAIAQVREYRDFFENPLNRQKVAERYGLTAYRPSAVVIIGRTPGNLTGEKLKQIRESAPNHVEVRTYDEQYHRMKRMLDLYSI